MSADPLNALHRCLRAHAVCDSRAVTAEDMNKYARIVHAQVPVEWFTVDLRPCAVHGLHSRAAYYPAVFTRERGQAIADHAVKAPRQVNNATDKSAWGLHQPHYSSYHLGGGGGNVSDMPSVVHQLYALVASEGLLPPRSTTEVTVMDLDTRYTAIAPFRGTSNAGPSRMVIFSFVSDLEITISTTSEAHHAASAHEHADRHRHRRQSVQSRLRRAAAPVAMSVMARRASARNGADVGGGSTVGKAHEQRCLVEAGSIFVLDDVDNVELAAVSVGDMVQRHVDHTAYANGHVLHSYGSGLPTNLGGRHVSVMLHMVSMPPASED